MEARSRSTTASHSGGRWIGSRFTASPYTRPRRRRSSAGAHHVRLRVVVSSSQPVSVTSTMSSMQIVPTCVGTIIGSM